MSKSVRNGRFVRAAVVAFGGAAIAALGGSTAVSAQRAQTASAQVTFTKDVAPILQRPASELPSARRDRADVADDLRGRAAVGALDQDSGSPGARCRRGHSTDDRHPEVQERSVAERRGDRDDRQVGRRRRAAGQRCRHAAAAASSTTSTAWHIGKPDIVVTYAEDVQDAGGRARPVRRPTPTPASTRIATSRRSRAASSTAVAQGRPSRAHRTRSTADDDDGTATTPAAAAASSSSSTRRARTATFYADDSGVLLKAGAEGALSAITSTRSARR